MVRAGGESWGAKVVDSTKLRGMNPGSDAE